MPKPVIRVRPRCRCFLVLAVLLAAVPQRSPAAPDDRARPDELKPDAGKIVLHVSKEKNAQYTSVQAAVDAAPDGAVVRVAPGVYEEKLKIRKPLTIEGAGWRQTTIAIPKQKLDPIELQAAWQQFDQESRAAGTDHDKRVIREAFLDKYGLYGVSIRDARGVRLSGLKITAGVPRKGSTHLPGALVMLRRCGLQMADSAVVGSPSGGIWIVEGSQAELHRCLIAAVWDTGIVIGERNEGPKARATVVDCDVRNCHYAGITIRAGCQATVKGCRISGAAWHGIRYDDTSPTIAGNRIFANARCGIYASGKTAAAVKGNLFCRSEGGGISCWYGNRDTIVGNTLADNARIGLSASGGARPTVQRNIFFGHPRAIGCSVIVDQKNPDDAVGAPRLRENLFWDNQTAMARYVPKQDGKMPEPETVELAPDTATVLIDPKFADAEAGDYCLASDSPARRDGIGAADPLGNQSPWPLQPEEAAIIPDGPTRDSRAWKQPPDEQTEQIVPKVPYKEALADLHEVLGRQYPCFELKGIDWKAVGEELLPRAETVKTNDEFGLLCMELVARLEDSHAYLRPAAISPPKPPMPQWDPGFACLMDDRGKPVVYHVDRGRPAEVAGVKVGMTVLSIDGRPVDEAIKACMKQTAKYWGYSSDRYLRYQAARWFARRIKPAADVELDMQTLDGKTQQFKLSAKVGVRYLPRLPVPIKNIADSGSVSWTMLEGNVGYIYVRRIRNDLIKSLDRAVGELKDARAMIVDVRGNSGGGFDSRRAHRNFAPDDDQEPDRPRFAGPMALLIDARCISAGEGWASWFIANKRAKVFGETTAGASSRKRTYALVNGLYQVTFPIKAYRGFLDRPIERRGLEPDVPLMQSAKDLAASRDTVLQAAKRHLLQTE